MCATRYQRDASLVRALLDEQRTQHPAVFHCVQLGSDLPLTNAGFGHLERQEFFAVGVHAT